MLILDNISIHYVINVGFVLRRCMVLIGMAQQSNRKMTIFSSFWVSQFSILNILVFHIIFLKLIVSHGPGSQVGNKELVIIRIYNNKITQMQESTQVLILGGSNFMGKELVDYLSQHIANVEIHLINRGKKYWNNDVYKDNPNIKYFYGDRNEHKQMNKAVNHLNEKLGITADRPWAAVVDFTSYKWRDLQSVTKALSNKTQLYVFISTDSLYNNTPFAGSPIRQDQYQLQEMYKQQKGTKIGDKYGYDKLKCEIYLQRRKHVPYINLRLPDVLGPYDNTNRYWCLLEWIKQSNKHPVEVNLKDQTSKLSFVYSKDIAVLIYKLITNRNTVDKYRSYNIACKQMATYQELVEAMSKALKPPVDVRYKAVTTQQSKGLFPSVNYTCINSDLATKEINWTPSPFSLCITETTQFFDKQADNYPTELKEMHKEFKKKVLEND